jgi:hypothetical protein
VLEILVNRVVDNELLSGLSDCHLVEQGFSIFQYADDTILLFQDDLEQARNLKFILHRFKQM